MSTAIKTVSHERKTEVLTVVFNYAPKDAYDYFPIPYQKDTAFQNAESLGGYFSKHIRPFAREVGKGEIGKDGVKYLFIKRAI